MPCSIQQYTAVTESGKVMDKSTIRQVLQIKVEIIMIILYFLYIHNDYLLYH